MSHICDEQFSKLVETKLKNQHQVIGIPSGNEYAATHDQKIGHVTKHKSWSSPKHRDWLYSWLIVLSKNIYKFCRILLHQASTRELWIQIKANWCITHLEYQREWIKETIRCNNARSPTSLSPFSNLVFIKLNQFVFDYNMIRLLVYFN